MRGQDIVWIVVASAWLLSYIAYRVSKRQYQRRRYGPVDGDWSRWRRAWLVADYATWFSGLAVIGATISWVTIQVLEVVNEQ